MFMQSGIPVLYSGDEIGQLNDETYHADANKAAIVIDSYLNGESVSYEAPYFVERTDVTEKTFEDRERMCRQHPCSDWWGGGRMTHI